MEFLLKMPKKKENTLIQIFTTSFKIVFNDHCDGASRISVEIVPFGSSWNVGLGI
jgi:hypothetical protein